MEEKAHITLCEKCNLPIIDGDELEGRFSGVMSGNTPVLWHYYYSHKKCPEKPSITQWATSFDSFD